MMKLPPYGKEVDALVKQKKKPNLFIYAGENAWKFAQWRLKYVGKGTTIVLPLGDDPTKYRWPVNGLEVLLAWPDGSRYEIEQLGRVLVLHGATLVAAPFDEDPEGCLFFRAAQRMAA